jgi:hypothetical protein
MNLEREHYSHQTAHRQREVWQKTLKECQKQGMSEEQIFTIKQEARKDRGK